MRELHAVQFDGMTFGMAIDAQSAAFRNFKKNWTAILITMKNLQRSCRKLLLAA